MTHLKCNIGEYAVIINQDKKALIVQLPPDSHHPGHWMLPGGRLEETDDASGGLIREIKEETKMEIEIITPCHVARWGSEDPMKYTVFFLCRPKSEEIELNYENQAFKWIDLKDLDKYLWLNKYFPEAIKKAQKLIENSI